MATHLVTATERPDGGKDFRIIQPTPNQEQQIAALKVEFEKSFGVDQLTRTADQWRNLVRVYGFDRVCAIEKMNENQVKEKMRG